MEFWLNKALVYLELGDDENMELCYAKASNLDSIGLNEILLSLFGDT